LEFRLEFRLVFQDQTFLIFERLKQRLLSNKSADKA